MDKKRYSNKAAWLVMVGVLFLLFCTCMRYRHLYHSYSAEELGILEIKSERDQDGDGVDDFTDIYQGALSYIETRPPYKSDYYLGGYPTDGYGVCTDVVWRAFQAAGFDLKSMVDRDIEEHREAYPKILNPDPNIDFRRVRNLKIFFERNAQNLTVDLTQIDQWQAGDIVIFNGHIAICSKKRNKKGMPFILHHGPIGAREANEIENYEIMGHYRWAEKIP